MSELKSAAVMADAAQADYFRIFLERERAELEGLKAKQVKQLAECRTTGAMRYISDARRRVMTEDELRCVERMVAALDQRFPDEVVRHRGQVQGCGVRGRRVIPRLRGSGGECRWGGLLF
jgi:hypothetical protein